MNVEIGTEAAQFPEKEYANGIFVAVYTKRFLVERQPRFHNPYMPKMVGRKLVRVTL
jgi:hypothetical protein